MKIIKLDATDSTNSFLKELAQHSALGNFTTVAASYQTKGRGQQEGFWISDKAKNLTFSTLVFFKDLEIQQQKYLNFAVSLAVFHALQGVGISNLSIKWPNDILAGNHKIGGILIENSIKNRKIQRAVIGIGLNVNQEIFPNFKRKATSVKTCLQSGFELDLLLHLVLASLQKKIQLLNTQQLELLENDYLKVMYKKNVPTMFKNRKNVLFMGIIKGVSLEGNLQVLLEDDLLKEFAIKEISFV